MYNNVFHQVWPQINRTILSLNSCSLAFLYPKPALFFFAARYLGDIDYLDDNTHNRS